MKTPDMLTTKQQIHNALEQLLVLFVKNNEYSANYSEKQRKELSLEEVHQIDTTLVALDELKAKIEQAQQAYEEARLTVAEKIKSMATN